MDSQLVKPLFDLPETVRKGDFVEKIDDAIAHAQRTVDTFVVTPALGEALDRALSLVGSALRDGRSQAAYLHGSFGSGKSHFMALLNLLLAGNDLAWSKPELHPLRTKHAFVGERKLLELHFHMIGRKNVESAIFGTYVGYVKAKHPEATLPGLFADADLFTDAAQLLDELGETKFFAPLNAGASEEAAGWGELANEARWTRERFDATRASTVPEERAELFDALAKSWFKSADHGSAFVDFDHGLAVMARHAKSLGYHGIVLFLDELILWLAHRAAEHAWLHNEVQKMVKLVEAQESQRDIPIVSFIAKQRDLKDMVGEEFVGVESSALHASLQHWKGRFDEITLEDRNLPAIVEKRILRPKDDASRALLDRAFDELKRKAGGSFDTLLGGDSPDAFRKLYPFSPALVEALVALSNSLQRQRTAIKLLVELLVEHMEDLEVGEVMRVGDLFDVLAGGEEAADGVMRARFEAAKKIYEHELLDLIRTSRQTNSPEKCQRLRNDHPVRLGCSNCPERGCRADNRLAKTLLIASLVPNVESLRGLTVSRLVQLNHGSVRSRIPGGEAQLAHSKLRDWAAQIGQIRLGTQADPTVSIQLEGVSLKPILDAARDRDQPGARQRVIRDLLFEAMGIDPSTDLNREHVHTWRHTKRTGRIRFGNVRKMTPEQLAGQPEHDFQIIVDYPFDDHGFGPNDDEQVLQDFEEQHGGAWTVVWLPSFFSRDINELLGDLVVLEHVLESRESKQRYLAHLRVEDRERAVLDLENLRSQKKARVQQALDQAYGLRNDKPGDLDPAASVEQHVRLLKPGAQLLRRMAPNLEDELHASIDALLDARYPRHPKLERALTPRLVETLVERFGHLVDSDDKRIGLDRATVLETRGTLGELGLVRTSENAVLLMTDSTLQRLEQARNREGAERPTVAQMRRWIDDTGTMGLQSLAEDLVVRCYARAEARTLVLHGKAFTADAKRAMPDEVELEKPDLPSLPDWNAAANMAGTLFGIALGSKALHGDNLKRLEQAVNEKVRACSGPARALPDALRARLQERDGSLACARLTTAESARALVEMLEPLGGRALVEALARFEPKSSATALSKQLPQLASAVALLRDNLVFGPFAQLARRPEIDGSELLTKVSAALESDELHQALSQLRDHANRAQALLNAESRHPEPPIINLGPPLAPPPPPEPPPLSPTLIDESLSLRVETAEAQLDALVTKARAVLAEHGADVEVVIRMQVRKKP